MVCVEIYTSWFIESSNCQNYPKYPPPSKTHEVQISFTDGRLYSTSADVNYGFFGALRSHIQSCGPIMDWCFRQFLGEYRKLVRCSVAGDG
jgi:hypothetical protein